MPERFAEDGVTIDDSGGDHRGIASVTSRAAIPGIPVDK
jgi:hypothetical protein